MTRQQRRAGERAADKRWRSPPQKPEWFRPIRSTAVAKPAEIQTAWTPQPGPQTEAITCPVEDLFYGGARGGGKTDFLLGDFAAHAGRYGEHAHGIIFRRTYSELEEVEKRALQIYTLLGAKYNQSKRTFRFPNRATLKLRYLLKKTDASAYQGHQYSWLGFDELGNWPSPEPIDLLWACLRSAAGVPCVRRCTGNPGGPGHLWVRERYVEPAPDGYEPFRFELPENPGRFIQAAYIPSKLDDNLLLQQSDPGYEDRIAAAAHGSLALWKAWRHGDWWSVVGAAFEEWRSDVHIARWKVPQGWRWAAGMDWGYSSPGWFGLVACGPEGRMYLRFEWYFRKKTPYEVGFKIGMLLKRNHRFMPEYIALDSACWATGDGRGGVRKSEAEEIERGLKAALRKHAPPVIAAPKDRESRVVRKTLMHEALRFQAQPDGKIEPWDMPKLQVHPDCKEFIRTIPALPVDEKDPDKVDTEAEDHPFDGMTYLMVARTPRVERDEVPQDRTNRVPEWKDLRDTPDPSEDDDRRWSQHIPGEDEDSWSNRWAHLAR